MVNNTVKHKIRVVEDITCKICFQSYKEDCRAYLVPISEEERAHREKGGPLCIPGVEGSPGICTPGKGLPLEELGTGGMKIER